MSRTAELAAQLKAADDADLVAALDRRELATAGIRDFFDLADALLDADSLQPCLARLDRDALAALYALEAGQTPRRGPDVDAALPRLRALLLIRDRPDGPEPWPEVIAQLDTWPSLGLPDPREDAPEPPTHRVTASGREHADRAAAERAFTAVTATAELLFEVEREPLRLLARGTIGNPETRRLAEAMGVEEPSVPVLVDAAEDAGLLTRIGSTLVASDEHADWLGRPMAERWATISDAWSVALPPELRHHLAEHADTLWGSGLRAWLAWQYPGGREWLAERVDARLGEAERLGITAGEVVGTAGAALLAGDRERALAAFDSLLPTPVERLYLQQDLTAVAPGPLAPAIDARLRTMADADGRAIASRYRFTTASVGRAVAGGESAATILAFLAGISLSGIPQPLEYLVTEAAARHGLLRVGALPSGDPEAVSYLSSTDRALLSTVLVDRALIALGLRPTDAGQLVSRRDRGQVYWMLHDARYPIAAEDSRGRIVELRRPSSARSVVEPAPQPHRALVERLRLADAGRAEDSGQAWLARQLDAAIRNRRAVTVSVRMPNGSIVDYRLEPASVAGGRLRARDPLSEIERTLPLSSITAVTTD
ncbi:hypothetical protein BKA04_000954 [Cryobacterium mesophilum]|uniref:Helicase XPB/Ssl2 N-terminal domain-containing protein n=1 Tax=Terrimesophilobacter mesophilus TaxID=433647 RepID=A0A4R8V8R2_9MICO|nr:helicase-associated domain-containing protein [Terrimesophilobacter mesophilus]MBB5632731.1 hypothetical protein [Terrimesophilobacter mesophilus]TFB79531.1 hypothetical protein E3N84_05390 [Terrimesophilobacter mesophilus]